MRTILQHPHPTLRTEAHAVPADAITQQRIQQLIADMKATLAAESDGVGLAAPQIGESFRIFIVAGRAFTKSEDEPTPNDLVCINPHITRHSKQTEAMEEGCLSVRGKYGTMERFSKATIRAYDEAGRPFSRGGSGLLAQIFQHEIDHLNGRLFIDRAHNIREIEPEVADTAEE